MAEDFEEKLDNELLPETDAAPDALISDEVLAISASIAATEVEGVAGMSSGVAGGIVEALGKVNLAKGVKVETKDGRTVVDLYVILKYGFRVPDVAWNIQEKVKNSIESLTGITVSAVNIHVQAIEFESREEDEDTEEN